MVSAQEFAVAASHTVGTRFRHRGRGDRGQDCVGPILGPARHFGLDVPDFQDYGRIPDESVVLAECERRCTPRDWSEHELPGRVLLFRQTPDGPLRHFGVSLGNGLAIHQERRATIIDLREKRELLHSVWLLNGVKP